jgi:hypothetical protein
MKYGGLEPSFLHLSVVDLEFSKRVRKHTHSIEPVHWQKEGFFRILEL